MLNADAVKQAITVINTGESRKVIFDCQAVRFFHNPITPLVLFRKRLTEEGGGWYCATSTLISPNFSELHA